MKKNSSSTSQKNAAILEKIGNFFMQGVIPFVFIICAILSFVALSGFHPHDQSFNTLSHTNIIQNDLGLVGAYFSDALLQYFGMASYILVLFFLLWAWARIRAPLPSFNNLGFRKLFAGLLGILFSVLGCLVILSSLLAYFAPGPLNAGMVGEAMLHFLNRNINPVGSKLGTQIALCILSLMGVLLFFNAARVSIKDYGLLVMSLGSIVLYLLKCIWHLISSVGQNLGLGIKSGFARYYTYRQQKKAEQSQKQAIKGQQAQENSKNPDSVQPPATPPMMTETEISTKPSHTPHTLKRQRIAPSFERDAPSQSTPQQSVIEPASSMTEQSHPPEEQPAKTITPRKDQNTELSKPSRHGKSNPNFQLPTLDLLQDPAPPIVSGKDNAEALQRNARKLEEVLNDFGVKGEIVRIKPGPVVTMYELEPAAGIKTTKVINLSDDIARNMRALSVRISTIPGNSALGVELPNERREMVNMKEILSSQGYQNARAKLPMILGKTIDGTPLIVDLASMPHLLIAGTTGSGKSVGLNVMLLSILYRLSPDECRVIMIDPKMLEFSVYDGIPHLLTPVVTEPKQAVVALKWTVREMENRYRLMSRVGVRNIDGYNARVAEAIAAGETLNRRVQVGTDPETGEPMFDTEELPTEPFPLIVVVVDEMADLMIVAGKELEASIQRLAQMARAAGIHLIMATQRPSVDVITGTIKANFPTRISYRVTSKIDSRTIIGEQGAEQLLGKGDLLLMQAAGNVTRVHAPFVEDAEVEKICNWLRAQRPPAYLEDVTNEGKVNADLGDAAAAMFETADGVTTPDSSLYDQAVAVVAKHQRASTSFVQRSLRIGYNRAADLIDEMEKNGVISSPDHKNSREVLVRHFEE